ncbi:MAG TPA: LysR family transcriptional regulator, partial [Stellaceae bacterium]|nr:LysR family transcriptional regulator [Stellaceae bacterium]
MSREPLIFLPFLAIPDRRLGDRSAQPDARGSASWGCRAKRNPDRRYLIEYLCVNQRYCIYLCSMRMKPTPQQLLAFLRLVETGGFSRAAGVLGVSQPTLSRTIKTIEDAIGARLFNRDTRNVELTSVGVELRPIAARLVKEFDSAFDQLTHLVEGQHGQITVAALPSISAVLLPRAIVRFRERNPGVDIAVRDSLSQPVLNSVIEGAADLGLTVHPAPSAKL